MRSFILASLGALALCGTAAADPQSNPAANSAGEFSHGFGMDGDSFEQPIQPSTRDANGNRLIVNGQIMTNTSLSGGISDGFSSGVGGSASSQAIGNQLNVVTQGNWNTVIVDSTQTNNGDISAVSHGDKN